MGFRIWSVDCGGRLRAGEFEGQEFFFYFVDNFVVAQGATVTNVNNEKVKRAVQAVNIPADAPKMEIKVVKVNP